MGGGTPKRDDSRSPARPDLAYAQPALRARHVWRSRCVYRSQPSPSPSGTVCSAPADLVSPEGVLLLSPPVKHLWQFLCTDPRPRYWVMSLVGICLSWLCVMLIFHLLFMSWTMFELVVQVEFNRDTVWILLGADYWEIYQEHPYNWILVQGLYIASGYSRIKWPWWTCPFFERFIASFTTQWEYVNDLSVATLFCGWFGMTLLWSVVMIQIGSRYFPGNVRVRVNRNLDHPLAGAGPVMRPRDRSPPRLPPPPNPLPQGFEKACGRCIRNKGCGSENNGTTTTLHKEKGEWPDLPVPPQCPQASPGGPIGSP